MSTLEVDSGVSIGCDVRIPLLACGCDIDFEPKRHARSLGLIDPAAVLFSPGASDACSVEVAGYLQPMNYLPQEAGHRRLDEAYGDEIRARAAQLRRQYPGCGVDFIVHSLEYDLGLRTVTIRRALAAGDAA